MVGRLRGLVWSPLVNGVLSSALVSVRVRRELLRLLGVHMSGPVEIRYGLDLLTPQLWLGSGVFLNRGVVINNTAPVTLGDHVAVGPGVLITTSHHHTYIPQHRQGPSEPRPVHVGAGSWLGARAVLLPGVTVGTGCVIAAGAVVTRDCEPNGVYAGVPARRIRELPDTWTPPPGWTPQG